jgi:hypothetical protein
MAMLGDPHNRSDRASAALERDAALGRISRARRWLLAGAAALTAALAALASALLPGKSLGAKPHSTATASRPAAHGSDPLTPRLPPPAGPAALGLHSNESDSTGSTGSGDGNSGAANSGNSGAANSGVGNSGSQAAQPAPAPAPAANSGNGGNSGAVVSGGS